MFTAPSHRARRILLIAAEIALVLAILGLLTLIWLPALVGPHVAPAPSRY